jgi:hypothetical protein
MTKTFYKYGDDGKYISDLHLDEIEAERQPNITEIPPEIQVGTHPYWLNGEWVQQAVSNDTDHKDTRTPMYPPIAEQLDMLWHAMDRGEIPIAEAFYESIKAVKDAAPKQETVYEIPIMQE